VRELNKKVLGIVLTLLFVAMLATPLVSAVPWNYPKNNDKFQSFETTLGIDPLPILFADWEFVPSEEKPNKLIISWVENMLSYEIKIGETSYYLDTDFVYSGVAVCTVWDPILDPPSPLPQGRIRHFRVDYMYDFSAVEGGIDGTIEMLALSRLGEMSIRSLRGTGDLQNVQIMATGAPPLGHVGIVLGWPE